MRDDLKSELVLDALGMAVAEQRLVAHSDHGTQYTRLVYGAYAKQSGIHLSMARSAIPGITRSPRPSSQAARKSCSGASASRPASTPAGASSGTSNASTTPAAASSLGGISPQDYEQRYYENKADAA
jgi:hypothetical protein